MRYTFSELRQGLRRNVSMHIAVVLTLFVCLTLVGIGVLLKFQAEKVADQLGSQLQITAWLCKDRDTDNPACTAEVTEAQKTAIADVVSANPEVASYYFESKETAFEKVKELLGPEQFEGPDAAVTAEDLPQSLWITLEDPQQDEGIKSAIQGLDGVSYIRDSRATLAPIYGVLDKLQVGSWSVAVFLVVAALLMVANTIRLAAFARRKEIGIMRLVGASTLYIALPFLLESLVTAAVGVLLAAGALGAFMRFGINDFAAGLQFLPWIGLPDYLSALVAIAVLAPVLTLVPTLLLTGKYLKV